MLDALVLVRRSEEAEEAAQVGSRRRGSRDRGGWRRRAAGRGRTDTQPETARSARLFTGSYFQKMKMA